MNIGQTTLASIGSYLSPVGKTKHFLDRIQQGISWRNTYWQRRRFQRRINREFGDRWNAFDAAYVHSNIFLASQISNRIPTILRLPGPVEPEFAPVLRSVHAVCANGDALATIRQFLGDHATELPIGINTQIFKPGFSPIRSTLGWSSEHRVIGYVGRLTHLKGVDILAAAFKSLPEALSSLRLLIIGKGAEESRIRSLLATEIARKLVHIEPDVEHRRLPDWYRAMDLCLMPSRYENFSNAVLEAMACGIPFLGSDVGGNKILAATGAGWLFQPESVSSLSASLCDIMKRPCAMRMRGAIGARYARDRYDWSVSAERLERIISSRLGAQISLRTGCRNE
jgi:glycosyltransferase involved in cell wall biosynthesis